jgi:hypothetical protein
MSREDLIDQIAEVLVVHDDNGASFCVCGKRLYSTGGVMAEGAMSLRRHRAEQIIAALGLEVDA